MTSARTRIAVTAMGSEGDIRPFVALAAGLRRAGHDAWLVAADRFRARAEGASVPFRPTGQQWDEAAYRAVMSKIFAEKNPLRQIKAFVEAGVSELVDAAPGVVEATRDAELIVHRRGVATAPMPLTKLTAETLAARLRAMDEPMRARAKALGDLVAAEDGVARACVLVSERLSSGLVSA
ncbi:MAG: glycosyltransferase [Myxococcota bacterium]|nr:glycosyltransferase [Myxococcota bacterium]